MPTKSAEIFRVLEDEIITCDLEPGTPLFEVKLSERFNVSRTPLREALLKLERQGLIRSVPYKGFAVNPISLKDIFDLYELRILIEVYNAGTAAERIDKETIKELEALVSQSYSETDPQFLKMWMRDDHAFHLKVALQTKNNRIYNLLSDILKQLQRIYYMGLKHRAGRASHEHHREILEAIKARSVAESKRLMRQHISLSRKQVLGALE